MPAFSPAMAATAHAASMSSGSSRGTDLGILSSEAASKCEAPSPGLGINPVDLAGGSSILGGIASIFDKCHDVTQAHYAARRISLLVGILALLGLLALAKAKPELLTNMGLPPVPDLSSGSSGSLVSGLSSFAPALSSLGLLSAAPALAAIPGAPALPALLSLPGIPALPVLPPLSG